MQVCQRALSDKCLTRQSHPARPTRFSRARVHVVKAAKKADGPSIAIVGITGAVGQEFLQVMDRANVACCGVIAELLYAFHVWIQ